ncbi:MAG TPA: class I SAM-dependent methyltransferase [Polyangiaceae bacterium]|nr:class I SAM-dependent methyltransferase [Polyangiaceae bacterium]
MDLKEAPAAGEFRRHPWEVARLRFFRRLLETHGVVRRPIRVLDAGAGDGWFLTEVVRRLPPGSRGVAWDPGYLRHGLPSLPSGAVPLDVTAESPAGAFDLILCLDVLEHVPDDERFLKDLATRNLADGGVALVSVPAWPLLWSDHDAALEHHRRYEPVRARRTIERAGLRVVESGGLFHSLLAPAALRALLDRLRPSRSERAPRSTLEWRWGRRSAEFITALLALESRASFRLARSGVEVPGLSFWALCRKA